MRIKNKELFEKITKEIDEVFNNVDRYQKLYKMDRRKAEEEISAYSALKSRASLGEKSVRSYLIDQYIIALMQVFNIDEKSINDFIDFEDIQNNHVQTIFEVLLEIYDVSEIIEKNKWSIRVSEEDIRRIAGEEAGLIKEKFDLKRKVKVLAAIMYASEYGQDVVDTLQHHNISEIGIIDKDYVYIVYKGNKIHLMFLSFEDRSIIQNIQKKTTQNSVVNFDKQNPTLVAAKNNSSRITAAGFDATPTDDDLYYNERIFNLAKITLEEMRDRYNTIDELIYRFLVLNQKGRGSHFVTGADMGVGKSTFLLAMMEKVPDNWGIGILDTQNELQARKKYPWKNILTLIENPKRTIAQCFEIMLKMARDVIYVGEITKPSEVAELVNSSLRLNSGVGATLHSKTPYEVVTNLRNLMMRTEMYNNGELAEADIARGIDIIVHLAKLETGRIVVESIVEVEYVEQDVYIEPVLEGKLKDKLSNLANMAQQAILKYLYRKNYHYNLIIRYDRTNDCWVPNNLPSQEYFSKIGRYIGENEITAYKGCFEECRKMVVG